MGNTELETWLKETKAKNLSLDELINFIDNQIDTHHEKVYLNLNGEGLVEKASILFNQWQKEAEFSPKRGDRVLVWDGNNQPKERIFLVEVKGAHYPFFTVHPQHEKEFMNSEVFESLEYEHMKPLPTELPTETDFKSKVIELIRDRIVIANNNLYDAVQNKLYDDAAIFQKDSQKLVELLNEIIKLC